MTSFKDSQEYVIGHTGELEVAQELQRRGYYVLPSYDYSGEDGNKAPRLQGLASSYVIPDLDVACDGKRMWVEVKTKSAATFTRMTQREEHGIPQRHLAHYLQVQKITGCPVWVAVYELNTGVVLVMSADAIDACGRRSRMLKGGHDEGGMVYFARDAMKQLFRVTDRSKLS